MLVGIVGSVGWLLGSRNPSEVADAVARTRAATQELERKDTEIEIERKERTIRAVMETPRADWRHPGEPRRKSP
jgi:hypothetical protein